MKNEKCSKFQKHLSRHVLFYRFWKAKASLGRVFIVFTYGDARSSSVSILVTTYHGHVFSCQDVAQSLSVILHSSVKEFTLVPLWVICPCANPKNLDSGTTRGFLKISELASHHFYMKVPSPWGYHALHFTTNEGFCNIFWIKMVIFSVASCRFLLCQFLICMRLDGWMDDVRLIEKGEIYHTLTLFWQLINSQEPITRNVHFPY